MNCFNIDDVQSLNIVTMVVSWLTFAIWWLCFGLLSTSERPVHWIYVWKGGGGGGGGGGEVVNDVLFTYTTYNITKKVFFGLLEFLYQTYKNIDLATAKSEAPIDKFIT